MAAEDTSPSRKVRKFVVENDVVLLQEVLAVPDAFLSASTSATWLGIAKRVAAADERLDGLTGRAAKERAEKMAREARAKENWRARQTGTAEQFGRKEAALVEVVELFEEAERKKKQEAGASAAKKAREETEKLEAEDIRNAASKTLSEKSKRNLEMCLDLNLQCD